MRSTVKELSIRSQDDVIALMYSKVGRVMFWKSFGPRNMYEYAMKYLWRGLMKKEHPLLLKDVGVAPMYSKAV